MTTAQSPVDVLRTALERIRDMFSATFQGEPYCLSCHHYSGHLAACPANIARTALTEAAALAAEVPAKTPSALDPACPTCGAPANACCIDADGSHPLHVHAARMMAAAAPPPAPVPGGMLPTGSIALFFDGERYRLTVGDVEATITWPAAATPHEVVVGMALKACKECGHSHWEHRREEPHACALCLCAAFDDVKTGGKLLASHPLVKPSPSTPPVQQQGEAKRRGRCGSHCEDCMVPSANACGGTPDKCNQCGAPFDDVRTPEAPTLPLGKCETCGGEPARPCTQCGSTHACDDCDGK